VRAFATKYPKSVLCSVLGDTQKFGETRLMTHDPNQHDVSGDQDQSKRAVSLLSRLGRVILGGGWKTLIVSACVLIILTLIYFFGLNMVTYPWAYGLTPQTPQGKWVGSLRLADGTVSLLSLDMAHDTRFYETGNRHTPDIQGTISICTDKKAAISARIYGDPKWTGISVVLFTPLDFGVGKEVETISCKAKKTGLECIFDFDRPLSPAEKETRDTYAYAYTPSTEFGAKIPIVFLPQQAGDAPFSERCTAGANK
jgi:hypothetical protein